MVHGQGPPTRCQLLVVVPSQFCGELPLNGGGALELVINLHTQPPPGFLELGRDVGCPLSSMGSELSHLEHTGRDKAKRETDRTVNMCTSPSDHRLWWGVKRRLACRCTAGLRVGVIRSGVQSGVAFYIDTALKRNP